jgi:hypothetical protein
MGNVFKKLFLVGSVLLFVFHISIAQQSEFSSNKDSVIPLEQFVGYFNIGVKPNKPFFKSRWYLRDGKLFIIYDSDRDRELIPYQNGELKSTIFLDEKEVEIKEKDSTYYLLLNFDKERLQSFRVFRPRSNWSTDLYGYRINELDNFAIDTERTLTYSYNTEHFIFESSPLDSAQIPELGNHLESKYQNLLADFNIDKLPTTKIRIYPDFHSYHNAVLTPNAPKWQRGRAWRSDEIRMLSPITAKKETGEDVQLNEVVLHEFIHCIHLSMIKNASRVPGWLWEGLAMYKGCCQWTKNPTDLAYIKNKKYPSLRQIENDRTFQLKYDLGYFIIKFLEQKYGWETILQLIKENGDIQKVLNISIKDFEKEFYRYLENDFK